MNIFQWNTSKQSQMLKIETIPNIKSDILEKKTPSLMQNLWTFDHFSMKINIFFDI